jgi:hypothetical protein
VGYEIQKEIVLRLSRVIDSACSHVHAIMRSSDNPGIDSLGDLGMHGVSSQMKLLYPHLQKFLSFLPAAGCLLGMDKALKAEL